MAFGVRKRESPHRHHHRTAFPAASPDTEDLGSNAAAPRRTLRCASRSGEKPAATRCGSRRNGGGPVVGGCPSWQGVVPMFSPLKDLKGWLCHVQPSWSRLHMINMIEKHYVDGGFSIFYSRMTRSSSDPPAEFRLSRLGRGTFEVHRRTQGRDGRRWWPAS